MESILDSETARKVSEFASDQAAKLRKQARRYGKRADGLVRENPWQVIGIAAVVGLAVGIFASRRT
jgi:ElaB/YqjD/DUF883 family membrane-anchored ribosome-binding protein